MCRGDRWRTLPVAAVGLWRLHAVASAVIFSALLWLAGWYWWPSDWLKALAWIGIAVGAVSTVAELIWLIPRRWRAYRYCLDERGLRQREGVLVARSLTVPANQILFVDVREGPVQRALGLSTVRIGTLGSTHDLGPVGAEEAAALAQAHLNRTVDHAPR
ncbi:MAG: PH domain-containing protein [Micropruina glycogenica]|uniref:YdbS-like PH domain-containing protein n=1 Tax=Micropruina glycogenica TaxID=75385 RepID=A0A2N9JGQ6_9ACTN|nr:PH domain-containing protein [Micropruina glycogenica]MCB0891651.1 PH domain-containing protein [Propionibacteriaceae bacterium]SPD86780.1 protein of unknown function [Micropruina glycogenica]